MRSHIRSHKVGSVERFCIKYDGSLVERVCNIILNQIEVIRKNNSL